MKKLITILLLVLVAFTATACEFAEVNKFDMLNELAQKSYVGTELNVTTTLGDDTLQSSFVASVTNGVTTVSYTVQRLNTFDLNGNIPTERISTVEGNYTIKDGVVVVGEASVEGDLSALAVSGLHFSEQALSDVEWSDNKMTARVTDAVSFVGSRLSGAKEMTVVVSFTTQAITALELQYTSADGAQVKLSYAFTA